MKRQRHDEYTSVFGANCNCWISSLCSISSVKEGVDHLLPRVNFAAQTPLGDRFTKIYLIFQIIILSLNIFDLKIVILHFTNIYYFEIDLKNVLQFENVRTSFRVSYFGLYEKNGAECQELSSLTKREESFSRKIMFK